MKTLLTLSMIVIILGFAACRQNDNTFFPEQLTNLNTGLSATFDSLNSDLSTSVVSLATKIDDTAAIRAGMKALFDQTSFVVEFSYVNPQGIMQIIEPPVFYATQGTDISQQSHIIQTFETKLPVLSHSFYAVENFYAAVDIHPILNNGEVLGGVTALFLPETILGRLIRPVVENQVYEIWIMEKGGKVLYDQDADEIGRNLFTDTLYTDFTELIAAAEKIDTEVSGETSYSFYQTGTTNKVVKKTYWTTFEMHGTEWKLIWVKPE